MITVNGWCAGGKEGGGGWVSVQLMSRWGKISVQTASNRFLKILTEGAITMEAGSLFQYFTTHTENADPLLRRWRFETILSLHKNRFLNSSTNK